MANLDKIDRGDNVYMNDDVVWSRETVERVVLAVPELGSKTAEIYLRGIKGCFKRRKDGSFHSGSRTLYSVMDLMADVLYKAYREAVVLREKEKVLAQERIQARRELNWSRQDELDAMNPEGARFGSTQSMVEAIIGATHSPIGISNTSEFKAQVAVELLFTNPNSSSATAVTLTLAAANSLVQQLLLQLNHAPELERNIAEFVKQWAEEDKASGWSGE